MTSKNKRDQEWEEAKRRCRLSADHIRMAKELEMSPRSLIKNIPGKTQRWKAPVRDWIAHLYEKQQRKIAARRASTLNTSSLAMSESTSRFSSESTPADVDFLFDDDSIPADADFLFDDDSIPDVDFQADDDSIPF